MTYITHIIYITDVTYIIGRIELIFKAYKKVMKYFL